MVGGGRDERAALRGVGDVGALGERVAPGLADRGHRRGGARLVDVTHDHRCAGRGQRQRAGTTEPGPAARHDRHLAVEGHVLSWGWGHWSAVIQNSATFTGAAPVGARERHRASVPHPEALGHPHRGGVLGLGE